MKRISRYALFVHLFVSLVFSSHVIYGVEEFQAELSTSYFDFEDDVNNERTGYSISISQYFSTVSTAGHPLAEAAFLERIGSIGLFVTSSKFKFPSLLGAEGDGLSYSASATYMKLNQPIFLQVFYSKSDDQFDTIFVGDTKIKRYILDVGLFLKEGLLVNVRYDHVKIKRSIIFLSNNATFLFEPTFKDKSYSIRAKFVKKLRNESAINLQGRVSINNFENPTDDGNNTIVQISGDYYFNRMTSVGLGLGTNSGDEKDNEGETYSVNLLVFLNPHFSVAFSYDQFFADNTLGEDEKLTIIAISARL